MTQLTKNFLADLPQPDVLLYIDFSLFWKFMKFHQHNFKRWNRPSPTIAWFKLKSRNFWLTVVALHHKKFRYRNGGNETRKGQLESERQSSDWPAIDRTRIGCHSWHRLAAINSRKGCVKVCRMRSDWIRCDSNSIKQWTRNQRLGQTENKCDIKNKLFDFLLVLCAFWVH